VQLAQKKFWIFDMDGTLTVPAHDFDAIRRELGLSLGKPILEQLAELPTERAEPLYRRLDEIEREIASRARPQPGASELLGAFRSRRFTLGIVTRNSHATALDTLRACALGGFFDPECVMSRERCALKPSGDGIRKLLAFWGASPADAVMVGDYVFDIMAGRDAGTATVFIDNLGRPEFAAQADTSVKDLHELLALVDHSERDDSFGGASNDRTQS
jgi:HAD superfamily hydrolase (TIGR01509 family)